jgi:hypothetical protein
VGGDSETPARADRLMLEAIEGAVALSGPLRFRNGMSAFDGDELIASYVYNRADMHGFGGC